MTGKDLFREVGNISEKYITEAEETKKSIIHNVAFRRGIGTAACLVLCVGIFAITRSGSKTADAPMASDSVPHYEYAGNSVDSVVDGTNNFYSDTSEMDTAADAENSIGNDLWDSERSESSATPENSTPSNSPEEVVGEEPEISDVEWFEYDDELIMERLQAYSNDYEELLKTDAFVVVHGIVKSGSSHWEEFWNSVDQGKPDFVDVVRFTDEGDAIITAIHFTGAYFRILEDHTRDAWGNPNCSFVDYGCLYAYLDVQEETTRVLLSDLKLDKDEVAEALLKKPYKFDELLQYKND